MGYKLLHGDDPSIEVSYGVFAKIRRALGTTAFGVNELRVPPNREGKAHDETETGHEELYCGIGGSATFIVDGEAVAFAKGDYLLVSPESTRQVIGGPDGVHFIVIGAKTKPEYDGRPIF
jgi:quercetin dioxygenase-like cupin family protein